jgi:transposase-like protein
MVQAVRQGESVRSVARRFAVSPATVSKWLSRSDGRRLDRVSFEDRQRGPKVAWNRVGIATERAVLEMRRRLRHDSLLGEFGAQAIHMELRAADRQVPAVATINRILKRHGAQDASRRRRRPAPPAGWYLPTLANASVDLDSFDLIEDLALRGGQRFGVLTAMAIHGRQVNAWPEVQLSAAMVVRRLIERWAELGLPAYAQFDNDTRFQGAHQFADTVGRVSRLCLSLGVVPVFAPPLEHGLQNAIEGFNALWQAKVWQRFTFASLAALDTHSYSYVRAHRARHALRAEQAPARRPFPIGWQLNLDAPLTGCLIYLRRTDDHGHVQLLGHRIPVDPLWSHRLVRCEVHFDYERIQCFALRRRDPADQPLLKQVHYRFPKRAFKGKR